MDKLFLCSCLLKDELIFVTWCLCVRSKTFKQEITSIICVCMVSVGLSARSVCVYAFVRALSERGDST